MMNMPLVTVICLCFNQKEWVEDAVASVRTQTYPNIELILIDDASTDGSDEVIRKLKLQYPDIRVVIHKDNLGNCKSFNEGFRMSRGQFIIDLAADDVLVANRVEKQVRCFQMLPENFGVIFTDATYIDEKGKLLYHHADYLFKKGIIKSMPEGDIYCDLISTYFIASPTMMIKRSVLEILNGYDETLAYEDFDFWIRSSRLYPYAWMDERLTFIRKRAGSMSTQAYRPGDKQAQSTFTICKKIASLNRTEDEKKALVYRLRYELRQCVLSDNLEEAKLYYDFLKAYTKQTWADQFWLSVAKSPIRFSLFRKYYLILRNFLVIN